MIKPTEFRDLIPGEIDPIIERLIARDWLITAFPVEGEELYNPAEFFKGTLQNNINYKVYLDLNILTYILDSIRLKPNNDRRDAIALVVFCQFCEINFEPELAICEKINYSKLFPDNIINEINLFRKIDNSDSKLLCKYALGKANSYTLSSHESIEDQTQLKQRLCEHDKLNELNSMYLLILKLVALDKENKSNNERLYEFISWMHSVFRDSLVATIFTLYLFSSKRIKNMLKYKSTASKEEKINQLKNMTWDLYFMNHFIRKWVNKNETDEILFASNDKVLRTVLKTAIKVNIHGSMDYLGEIYPEWKIFSKIKDDLKDKERTYLSEKWSPEYRDELIKEYERILL